MPLNIKNERVSGLAQELAKETGESLTDAVGKAIEDRLAGLKRSARRHGLSDRMLAIGRSCASQAPKEWLTHDFEADLYDENGLPR
jgi:antitoxin VapB